MGFKCSDETESTNFADDLGMDSLDVVELTLLVEKEFDIYIDDGSASELKTLDDLIVFVDKRKIS